MKLYGSCLMKVSVYQFPLQGVGHKMPKTSRNLENKRGDKVLQIIVTLALGRTHQDATFGD